MVSFWKILTESHVLISLPPVLREIISPKRTKRKNQEGYELLDFFENMMLKKTRVSAQKRWVSELVWQPGQINVKDGNVDLSESDSSSDEVLQNPAMTTYPDKSEIEATRSHFVTLSDLFIKTDIGKSTLFLDSMAKVIEIDTRQIFLGHLHKF